MNCYYGLGWVRQASIYKWRWGVPRDENAWLERVWIHGL